jgi:hypothetical protein
MAIIDAVRWHNKWYKAEAVNKNQWFGTCWLVMIPAGFEAYMFIVEADHEADALDELVDSKFGHLLIADNQEEIEEDSDFGGNNGLLLDKYTVECTTITKLREGEYLYGISQKDMDKLNGD